MTDSYVYGIHAVNSLLKSGLRPTKKIFLNQERVDKKMQDVLELAKAQGIVIERLNADKMNQRFAEYNHQGIVALVGALKEYSEADLVDLIQQAKKPCLILILDGVTDPHNLGACLRSADATAVDFVVIPKDKSVGITPVVSKVACGAAEAIPLVRVTNLARAMEIIKAEGVWIYGAAGETDGSIYQLDCKISIAIAMGAEGAGLRRLTRENCDYLFALPMLGGVESLNVSVATGVSLYEVVRQRQ